MLGKFDVAWETPPAAAGTPPSGEAVESGSWATYNRKSTERTSPIPVPSLSPRPQTRRAYSREPGPREEPGSRKRSVSYSRFVDSTGRDRSARTRHSPISNHTRPPSTLRQPSADPDFGGNLPGLNTSSTDQHKRTQDYWYQQRAHSRDVRKRQDTTPGAACGPSRPGLQAQTKFIPPPPGPNPDALPIGPKANPVPWLSLSRELQAKRGGDKLIDEDVFQAIADAKLHCGHCGGTGHTLLTCSWAPGIGTRHLPEEGQLAPGLVVTAGGKVHGDQLSAP